MVTYFQFSHKLFKLNKDDIKSHIIHSSQFLHEKLSCFFMMIPYTVLQPYKLVHIYHLNKKIFYKRYQLIRWSCSPCSYECHMMEEFFQIIVAINRMNRNLSMIAYVCVHSLSFCIFQLCLNICVKMHISKLIPLGPINIVIAYDPT